jgi:hypothetical protein
MSDPADLLEHSFKRTARGMIIIGTGVIGLGLFMMGLHIFDLDPEASSMGTGMLIALYVFALLFVATGAGMLYVGIIKSPADDKEIRALVAHSPQEIKKFWRWVTTGTGDPDGIGSQNFIKIETRSGKLHQISVRKDDVHPILDYLGAQAPEAERGPVEVQKTS